MAQRNHALDAALGRGRRARSRLDATIDSLRRVASPIAIRNSTHPAWQAHFDMRRAPYTIAADVEMPAPPDSARLEMHVALDPIHVDARVTCSSPNELGIRPASIVASTPPWERLRFDRVEQSPEVCASPALTRARQPHRVFEFTPLVVGGGRVITANGSGSWGLFLGAGFQLWN